jgi:hypothetical protein
MLEVEDHDDGRRKPLGWRSKDLELDVLIEEERSLPDERTWPCGCRTGKHLPAGINTQLSADT